jgi:hypothetical protein
MLAVFRKFLVLFICFQMASFGQVVDNVATIELGQTSFPIERPFTISVTIAASDTRPVLAFPDIPGFVKKGMLTSVTSPDMGSKTAASQIITQNYQARAPGRFLLAPFAITVNGELIRSEGAVLVVRPSVTTAAPAPLPLPSADGAAFLALRVSKSSVYMGEGVGLTLSFFVADNYPYVLNFTALDRQLQTILKKIRPANAWEENRPINDLQPVPVVIQGRKFREIQLYQSVFYPLSARTLTIPSVTLTLTRPRPVIGPPSPQTETVAFASKPVAVTVRGLPAHPLRGQVAVGSFRLNERLDRQRVLVGQSVRYSFTIDGIGNIATLPAPIESAQTADVDLFPPKERHTLKHGGNQVSGQKTFTYFIVPRQNGPVSLADHLQWIYFDPERSRYDTLRPRLRVEVGGTSTPTVADASTPAGRTSVASDAGPASPAGVSLYAGIEALDSTQQPISIPVLIRAIANVLIVLMLLGMIFVFFKK